MAHDEVCKWKFRNASPDLISVLKVFAGPMSESVPSSITGFAHRRPRSDSIPSFTYFQEDDESPEWSDDQAVFDEDQDTEDADNLADSTYDYDLESGQPPSLRRKTSPYLRASAEGPLLLRRGSSKSDASAFQREAHASQKIYVLSEDLTIVIAGFCTRSLGFVLYIITCTFSLGLGYLIFRWLPRWKVRLVGSSRPLRVCDWVVIEVRLLHYPSRLKIQQLKRLRTNGAKWVSKISSELLMGMHFPLFLARGLPKDVPPITMKTMIPFYVIFAFLTTGISAYSSIRSKTSSLYAATGPIHLGKV